MSNPQPHAAVTFRGVSVMAGGNAILESVSATVPVGSSTAIVGPNGAGKTTLLLALLREWPFTGDITVAPTTSGRAARIGYVPQRLQFDRGLPVTVLEFLCLGRQRLPLWFGVRRAQRDRARELLAAVKAGGVERRRLGALSGGELQRVLLALALAQDPDLLVLDEPAAGVDFSGEHIICELLEDLRRTRRFTQLMVSHDLATVTHHADHVICLNRRVAAEGPPATVLTPATLASVFGIHMGLIDRGALPAVTGSATCGCDHGEGKEPHA